MSVHEQSVISCLKRLKRHAEQFLQCDLPCFDVRFDLRGRGAGELRVVRSHPRKKQASYALRFNDTLLSEYKDYFFSDVLPHEMAHLVVDVIHGPKVRPHGVEWQSVMINCFQVAPKAYHSLPTQPVKRIKAEFRYRCACQEHLLTVIRHRRAMKGVVYSCRRCGDPLRWANRG